MKTVKSHEEKEVTPSKKKLTQARLPFKILSDVSPKPDACQARKRKLSVPDTEPITKVTKISKENSIVDNLVVISDEESRDSSIPQNDVGLSNPYVNLVDVARKKRLQKAKSQKKTKKGKSKKLTNGSVVTKTMSEDEAYDDVEIVEVDVIIHVHGENETKIQTESPIIPTNDNSDTKNTCENKIVILKDTENILKTDSTMEQLPEKQSEVPNKLSHEVCLEKPNNPANTALETKECMTTCSDNNKETKDIVKKPEIQGTPKRSTRIKSMVETAATPTKTKPNESVPSNPTTPKHNKSLSSANSLDDSMDTSTIPTANLTPKQLQKKLESAKKREEREKEKLEREQKRQQEKEERAKQRQEKEDQRKREKEEKEEAKRKEREEKEDQKRKEREEKEKQKEQEKKLREAMEEMKRKDKENKEEQRRKEKEAKEEERRKRQEALEQEKLEQEQKKKKAAEAFANFFVAKQKVDKDRSIGMVSKNSMLSSFTIKSDMRLAPNFRVDLSDEKRETLDKHLKEQDLTTDLYLKALKEKLTVPLSSGKTWPLYDKDDDVMIIEDELPPIDGTGEIITCEPMVSEKLRPKLFSFHENRRPPYWGTFRKKSSYIKPRRPFGHDKKQLDYEVDSDDDWEEEQEGESLDGSACGSEDEDAKDDYEVDNEFFVPHGYLSDEEATMDDGDVLALSPETQQARLKHLEDEFESEMKKPTEKLKPRLYGLLWETKEGGKPEKCVDALWSYFEKFSMIMNDPTPLLQPAIESEETDKKKNKKKKIANDSDKQSPKSEKKKKRKHENEEKVEAKKDSKKVTQNQPGINYFLTKLKSI